MGNFYNYEKKMDDVDIDHHELREEISEQSDLLHKEFRENIVNS
jgi:hypothetical protein